MLTIIVRTTIIVSTCSPYHVADKELHVLKIIVSTCSPYHVADKISLFPRLSHLSNTLHLSGVVIVQ